MANAAELLERMERLDLDKIKEETAQETIGQVPDLIRGQLMKGLGGDGRPLSPKHSENPYFKSKESALRYAMWKHKLNPEAPFDVPDLKITGYTHDSIFAAVEGQNYRIGSNVPWAADIERTFKGVQFELTDESIQVYRERYYPIAQQKVKEITGLP